MTSVEQLYEEAMRLPERDRSLLAHQIVASLADYDESGEEVEDDYIEAWRAEVTRRLSSGVQEESHTVPWEEVRQRLFARFNVEPPSRT